MVFTHPILFFLFCVWRELVSTGENFQCWIQRNFKDMAVAFLIKLDSY